MAGTEDSKQTATEQPKKVDKKAARKAAREAALNAELDAKLVPISFEEYLKQEKNFGRIPRIQSQGTVDREYTKVKELNKDKIDQTVFVRARVFHVKGKGKLCFVVLRDRYYTVQCVGSQSDSFPKEMLKFCTAIPGESIVDIEGKIVSAETKCTQGDVELQISKIYLIDAAARALPIQIEDAMRPDAEDEETDTQKENSGKKDKVAIHVGQEQRLDNRILDLRVPAHVAIFRIQSAVSTLFREFLLKHDFTEIHTPKLIAAASEGGADVFPVKYFGGNAFLAQSPQLYKQMAVQGDLNRVFEIGPVFRAEKSFTGRHLTEFVGLDMEMDIKSHYHEVLDVLSDMFVYIFEQIPKRFGKELEIISQQYPFEPLKYDQKALRITYSEGIELLRQYFKNNGQEEQAEELSVTSDISTDQEKLIGAQVKEKYNTDVFVMDKYPLSVRPFYTMPCPDDDRFSNSYDIFVRGQEISSGAQRIHDADYLTQRAQSLDIPTEPLQDYINAFKYGGIPHGGAGLGLERVTMLYLGLHNVRKTSMFPRDPKRLRP
eukprot:gb/GECH01011894.1/.p1 GENE.gb/GECH01011894.1/~~gb/GECH01011894.1/.p1  ORF type:complete len:546 (+),score=162.05 gb/GECH01011894.1/:1-1638(+)